MAATPFRKFFFSIVAPTILAIFLFVVSFWALIIPLFEKNMMDRKKEMIQELTNSAWSIIDEQYAAYKKGFIDLEAAQEQTAYQINKMRYGANRKDYFWIIDMSPRMIMHPYRSELIGRSLSEFKDSHEKKLFVDAVKVVNDNNEGFINYYWQWKDDTTRIVPKLSFVKGFEPWNWIVGTGIYLEDVQLELSQLKRRLVTISSLIILIIIVTLSYLVRQSFLIEKNRRATEERLFLSKQKYKTLVEASTDGTLMFVNGQVIFNNLKFAMLYECASYEIIGQTFDKLFNFTWNELLSLFSDPKKSVSLETQITCQEKATKDVVISVSKIDYSNQEAYIVIVKELSRQKLFEKGSQNLTQELHNALLLMNQPIKPIVIEMVTCSPEISIQEASQLMSARNQKVVFIMQNRQPIGVFTDSDIKKRVVGAGLNANTSIIEVMSAPVVSISENALLYQAVLLFKQQGVSHLLVKDAMNRTIGVLNQQETLEMQRNSLSFLIQEIESCKQVEALKQIYHRLPILVNALISNGGNAQHTAHIIASVADAISAKVVELSIETHGKPPVDFAFMVMGSEGRQEQTLKTDQDNAIIFEDSQGRADVKDYFISLGKTISKNLNAIGYNLCEGEIMASNPKWCNSLSDWQNQFSIWIASPDAQHVLDSNIFFDFRCVYGNGQLTEALRNHINVLLQHNDLFFFHLANSIIKYKPDLVEEFYDLKKIILPLIGYLRFYALRHQINQTNSMERLTLLSEKQVINEQNSINLRQTYNFLMQLRLTNQSQALLDQENAENTIHQNQLSNLEKICLKKAMDDLTSLQTHLSLEFK